MDTMKQHHVHSTIQSMYKFSEKPAHGKLGGMHSQMSDERSYFGLSDLDMSARSSSSSSSKSQPLISSWSLLTFPNSNSNFASSECVSSICSDFTGDFGESTGTSLGEEGAWTGEWLASDLSLVERLDPDLSFIGSFALRTSMSSVGLSTDSNTSLSFSISENKVLTSASSCLKIERERWFVQLQGSQARKRDSVIKDEKSQEYLELAPCSE